MKAEEINVIHNIDCLSGLKQLPDNFVDCCVTSPPYWGLRDYGVDGQIGNENEFTDFINKLAEIYKEVYRVLKPEGTCFVNLGDTYGGSGSGTTKNADTSEYVKNSKQVYVLPNGTAKSSKFRGTTLNKCLLMIPERFAIRMIDEGWVLRNQIIWHKPNQMPSSATDRFTVDFEKIFFFVKEANGYYFEQQLEPYTENSDAEYRKTLRIGKFYRTKEPYKNNIHYHKNLKEKGQQNHSMHEKRANGDREYNYNPDGKNMRTVWSINTKPYNEAHFATYPELLVSRIIKAGCPENGIVLDPFMGAGTTALVAKKLNRNYIGFELNPEYIKIAEKRLYKEIGMFL